MTYLCGNCVINDQSPYCSMEESVKAFLDQCVTASIYVETPKNPEYPYIYLNLASPGTGVRSGNSCTRFDTILRVNAYECSRAKASALANSLSKCLQKCCCGEWQCGSWTIITMPYPHVVRVNNGYAGNLQVPVSIFVAGS